MSGFKYDSFHSHYSLILFKLTNGSVSTFGLNLSHMSFTRALFDVPGTIFRDEQLIGLMPRSIYNDRRNFNNRKRNYMRSLQ